ncbi:MAG: 3'-5' exonuclease [Pyrinomonadaceae bacterium]
MNPFDDIALMRVINTPTRGLGKTSLDEVQRIAKSNGAALWTTIGSVTDEIFAQESGLTPRAKEALRAFKKVIENLNSKISEYSESGRAVSEVVIGAIEDTGYANSLRAENTDESAVRLENLEELVNAAVDYDKQEENGLRDFIDHSALTSDTDKYDGTAPVTLMTVHMAKGLEFPIVFLVGLEDGIFPHSRSLNDPKELEEERRLAYVAITRAEKMLYVTHSMRRRVYGEEIAAEPSQFLNEMPLELIDDLSHGASWLSYARSTTSMSAKATISALRGENAPPPPKPKNLYAGKTYNSSDAVAEFFKKKNIDITSRPNDRQPEKPVSGYEKLKAAGTPASQRSDPNMLVAGSHVRHEKYGRGLVLRREGSGDNVKLTVSFAGFGQKKLIEKFANLQKD